VLPGQKLSVEIELATRAGTHIENEQCQELTPGELMYANDFVKKYRDIRIRTDPNPVYNCHGLTFGGRRTEINLDDFSWILEEDGYTLRDESDVLPGDIILYINTRSGGTTHSGIVVAPPNPPQRLLPLILSKWGICGEVIHEAHNKPSQYGDSRQYYRLDT
jgi:hypothetical protein